MFSIARHLLFQLSAETAHEVTLDALSAAARLRLLPALAPTIPAAPVEVMGMQFDNPVGLAAGLDKNGSCIDGLAGLGFGFLEIGTITPRPQPGNPKPRLFRIPEAKAIVNRMGFNNQGVDALVANVKAARFNGILGINIGKNFDTPVEHAVDDYLICMQKVYAHASYITVNISSPNTPGLRELQYGESLRQLLARLKQEQAVLAEVHGRYVPLAVKIAPDMDSEQLAGVALCLQEQKMDAVIATNTTLSRQGVEHYANGDEAGGLSGAPLTDRSTAVIAELYGLLGDAIPIIGVGGITCGDDARAKLNAGAKLVQIYSGFIYSGPKLISDCASQLTE
ncbi:MAG: quinone-dependent dihydroorotate dehydrogenase [Gammaproteobacteria bacterium]|nr:quinone-dependent dihydroorotate dehydrogenase [Gammaproteobacteria bacterium]MCP4881901.1 quinone-dependent dihydroorotate dehydrogenase [Gammaproteobacteria bacterium]